VGRVAPRPPTWVGSLVAATTAPARSLRSPVRDRALDIDRTMDADSIDAKLASILGQ
jgi:hypothetical protein